MIFQVVPLREHGDLTGELDGRPSFRFGANSMEEALIAAPQIRPGIYAVRKEGDSEWIGYEVALEKRATPFRVLKVTGHEESKETVHGHLAWLCNPTLADDQS